MNGDLWHALLGAAHDGAETFRKGERVQTRSGGAVMTVLEIDGADVKCAIGTSVYKISPLILRRVRSASELPVRRGRKPCRAEAATAPSDTVPGAIFSSADLATMREHYAAASKRLALDDKPELQRAIAIAIIRTYAGQV